MNNPTCLIRKVHPDAVIPYKTISSDVGFDLSVVSKVKDFNNTTSLYDTGLQIKVPEGWYSEIVPRSSLSKSGYMMANSIGIIDNTYRGNLLVALTKIDLDAQPIQFPFRCCQLIVRQQVFPIIVEVDGEFDVTERGDGGFGST